MGYTRFVKRSEILFGLAKIPLDALAALAALLLAYQLRVANIDLLPTVQLITQPAQLPPYSYYVGHFALPAVGLYLALMAVFRLYSLQLTMSAWREVGDILLVALLWLALIIAWFFLIQRQLFFSRVLLLQATFLTAVFTVVARSLILLIQRSCLRHGIGVRAVLSFGSQHLPELARRTLARDVRFKYLGHVASMHSLTRQEHLRSVDLVLHTDPNPNSEETIHLINHCRSHHIGYAFLPPVFADVPHQLTVFRLGTVPVLRFQPTPIDGWGRVVKRAFDFAVAILITVVLLPLLLLIGLVIWVVDGLPLLYVSRRVGQHGNRLISILKFRTMVPDADGRKGALKDLSHRGDGPLFKIKHDPRVTPFGRFLRRWSLDELPQLLNVIAGQLSIVGPRPHLSEEVARYNADQRRVFAVKPGITGIS